MYQSEKDAHIARIQEAIKGLDSRYPIERIAIVFTNQAVVYEPKNDSEDLSWATNAFKEVLNQRLAQIQEIKADPDPEPQV